MEALVEGALQKAKLAFVTDNGGGNPAGLDFHLAGPDVHIEVKRFHSERIAEQMSRAANVIALQGEAAVRFFAGLVEGTSERAPLAPPNRDAMVRRTEEEWEDLEEAIGIVYALRAGHTLTDADVAALELVDKCQRDDEEGATEAYHRGRAEGLVERGGDELLELVRREEKAFLDKLTERTLKVFAQQRARKAEEAARVLVEALKVAKGYLEHQAQWIASQTEGYSFEALGEDIWAINEALAQGDAVCAGPSDSNATNGEAAADPRTGWVMTNAERTRFRAWISGGTTWVDDVKLATFYARRIDAEAVHLDDDVAWGVHEMPLPEDAA